MRKLLLGLFGAASLGAGVLGLGAVTALPAEAAPFNAGYRVQETSADLYQPAQYYRHYYHRPYYGYRPYRYGYRPYRYARPYYYGPRCIWRTRQVWNGYRWVWRNVRVCRY